MIIGDYMSRKLIKLDGYTEDISEFVDVIPDSDIEDEDVEIFNVVGFRNWVIKEIKEIKELIKK